MALGWIFAVLALGQTRETAAPCPPPPPGALDLNWSATDANGFPRNPWWVGQDSSPAAIDPECACGGFPVNTGVPFGDPKCTDTSSSDLPRGFHKLTCKLEWLNDFRNGVTRGHINWFPVVLTGYAWYANHSGADDDVNFELAPDTKAPNGAVPGQTKWNATAGELNRTDTLHIEMKKSETLDHLGQDWWKKLNAAADSDEGRTMVEGARAVAIGLFGIDAEHKGHAEAHPAYALALRTACLPSSSAVTETWAVFVRNYGNEGWCSQWDKWHRLDLDNNALVLQLPLDAPAKKIALVPGVSAVSAASGAASGARKGKRRSATPFPPLYSNRAGGTVALVSNAGSSADVQVAWKPLGPADELRVHGSVTFTWQPAATGGALCSHPRALELAPLPRGTDEGEALLDDLSRRARGRRTEAARASQGPDAEPVTLGPPVTSPIQRSGICPHNAATCSDDVRARTRDGFFTTATLESLEESHDVTQEDRAMCEAARSALPDYTARAAGKPIDSSEGKSLRRLESLISICEVGEDVAPPPR
jgi:hypothetical protein